MKTKRKKETFTKSRIRLVLLIILIIKYQNEINRLNEIKDTLTNGYCLNL